MEVTARITNHELDAAWQPQSIPPLMRKLAEHNKWGHLERPGFIILSRLLVDDSPEMRFQQVAAMLGDYMLKSEVWWITTPAGGEPLHVGENDLAAGADWRLRQLDPDHPGKVNVVLGTARAGDVSPGDTIVSDRTVHNMVSVILFRRFIRPGDVALFHPATPYSFNDAENRARPLRFATVDIGPTGGV